MISFFAYHFHLKQQPTSARLEILIILNVQKYGDSRINCIFDHFGYVFSHSLSLSRYYRSIVDQLADASYTLYKRTVQYR
jgi:hypothetical protein